MLCVERQNYTSTGRYEAMNRNSDVKESFITVAVRRFHASGTRPGLLQPREQLWLNKTSQVIMSLTGGSNSNTQCARENCRQLHNTSPVCARQCRPAQNTLVDMNLLPEVSLIYFYWDRQQIRNTWKVLKCGAEEGWKRSAGLIM